METACSLSGSAKSSREIRCPRAENPGVGLSGRVSDVSGVVTILLSAPPPSPSDLRAAMRAQQAHIIMHSEATAIMHATTSADATGLVLHWSEAGSSTWPAPSRWWTGSSAFLSGEFLLHSGSDAAHAARLKYTVITCANRSTSGLALRPHTRPSSATGERVEDYGTAGKMLSKILNVRCFFSEIERDRRLRSVSAGVSRPLAACAAKTACVEPGCGC